MLIRTCRPAASAERNLTVSLTTSLKSSSRNSKGAFFRTVIVDGALPRKTFSMGEAREKRFYMEARRIV